MSIKTSITGKLNKQDLTHSNPAAGYVKPPHGFTLIEVMLVIALIGVILFLAVPVTRDTLMTGKLKKASRELIGLERKLRVEAVRDQTDYILCIDIPSATYWVITSDMTPEKLSEVKKAAKQLPSGITILDIVGEKNQKKSTGEIKIKFGRNNLCPPLVIHLAEDENKMTLVVNPFLGITKIYDKYVDVSVDDGLGKNNPGQS